MTTAQIIMFPLHRVAIDKQPEQRLERPAEIIIFHGVHQEPLKPKHIRQIRAGSGKAKRPSI